MLKVVHIIDEFFFYILMYVFIGIAFVVFIALFFVTAGYGQHTSKKWGPAINNKLGWVIMEIPTVVIFMIFWLLGRPERRFALVPLIFMGIWMLHYCQRTFIFPLLIRGKDVIPFSIILFGGVFNGINAYLQSEWIFRYSPVEYTEAWFFNPIFYAGIGIFLCGFIINLHSDNIIRNLRAPGETDFRIPYGGLFKYVSCPSYFGEITEWVGWAVMTSSLGILGVPFLICLPGITFSVWTFANLAPRARSNHQWYLQTFPDYPKNRKALIPFIL